MELIKQIGYDQNSTPPTNYYWAKDDAILKHNESSHFGEPTEEFTQLPDYIDEAANNMLESKGVKITVDLKNGTELAEDHTNETVIQTTSYLDNGIWAIRSTPGSSNPIFPIQNITIPEGYTEDMYDETSGDEYKLTVTKTFNITCYNDNVGSVVEYMQTPSDCYTVIPI